jgi:ketosteroid isomerase-like protein
MAVEKMEDFRALEPFFRVIEEGLEGLVDGSHFLDLLAEDVVFEFIITVPEYPRRVEGRARVIELFRGYHTVFFLDRCFDLRVHRADDSTVTLEYASAGKAVATGRPYGNRYVSVVTIRDRKIVHWRDYLDPLRVFAALEVQGSTRSPA